MKTLVLMYHNLVSSMKILEGNLGCKVDYFSMPLELKHFSAVNTLKGKFQPIVPPDGWNKKGLDNQAHLRGGLENIGRRTSDITVHPWDGHWH